MTIRNLLLAGVAVAGLAAPALAANDIEVGSVWDREYHDAQGLRINGDIAPLHYRDTVYAQEKVTTGPAGRTALHCKRAARTRRGSARSPLSSGPVRHADVTGRQERRPR